MSTSNTGLFIVWRIFQRRTESLAREFNLDVCYYYRPWEEKSKFHKALSYIFKTFGTVTDLIRHKPPIVFIQLPPTPLLYIVATYCKITGSKLVADCHNSMIYSRWLRWPLAKALLRRADITLVHNKDVEVYAKRFNLDTITLRDPLPVLESPSQSNLLDRIGISENHYIIVPWSFAPDEPINELIQAAAALPDIIFVMTWFAEKLPPGVRNSLPPNLILSGYLDDEDFNTLFSKSIAAIVLTTREGTQPSAASEAIVLGIPLIVSDLNTTRQLYDNMPIYTKNTSEGIREAAQEVVDNHDKYQSKITVFKDNFAKRLNQEIRDVKSTLGLMDTHQK